MWKAGWDNFVYCLKSQLESLVVIWVQFSPVAQLCPNLCDPMNRSMPGLPVHHQLPEFTQTHVHRIHDAIQPSQPFSSCPQSLPASKSFPMSQLFTWGGQSTGASALASFLPNKSQGWSPGKSLTEGASQIPVTNDSTLHQLKPPHPSHVEGPVGPRRLGLATYPNPRPSSLTIPHNERIKATPNTVQAWTSLTCLVRVQEPHLVALRH